MKAQGRRIAPRPEKFCARSCPGRALFGRLRARYRISLNPPHYYQDLLAFAPTSTKLSVRYGTTLEAFISSIRRSGERAKFDIRSDMVPARQIEQTIEKRAGQQRSEAALFFPDRGVQLHRLVCCPKSLPTVAIRSSGDHIELAQHHPR